MNRDKERNQAGCKTKPLKYLKYKRCPCLQTHITHPITDKPVQPEVHHVEPQLDRVDLDEPEEHPADSEEEEEEEPEPDDEEHL